MKDVENKNECRTRYIVAETVSAFVRTSYISMKNRILIPLYPLFKNILNL